MRLLVVEAPGQSLADILAAIRSSGFEAELLGGGGSDGARADGHAETSSENAGMPRLIAAPLFALVAEAVGFWAPDAVLWKGIEMAVAAAAIALSGFTTYKKGIGALARGRLNINGLMAVAVTGAFLIGQWPEAAMVMALCAIAELIEARAADRARGAITRLMALAPPVAEVRQGDGTWKNVDAGDVASDRFAAIYTPAVFVIALGVALLGPFVGGWAWSAAIYKALVLLVIACPCALVISTPVTVVSGLAAAARRGILVKGGVHPEEAHRIKAVAFGTLDGETLTLANHRLIEDMKLCSADLETRLLEQERQGRTVTMLASTERVLALFAVADTIKPSARDAVAGLRELGVTPVLLTGDNAATAQTIGAQAGIREIRGNLLPEEKLAAIKELKHRFGPTAMVGDGINDAPALAEADIGIAMGGAGTDIAMEAAVT